MKRYILCLPAFAVRLLTFVSCAKEQPEIQQGKEPETVSSYFVSEEQAIVNLTEFISGFEATRGMQERKIADVTRYGGFGATRSDSQEMDEPLVYVVNFEDNGGWAIVSGDTRTTPVIALIEKGNFNRGDVLDNPGAVAMFSIADVNYRMDTGMAVLNDEGEWVEPVGVDDTGRYIYPDMVSPDIESNLNPVIPNVQTRAMTGYVYSPWSNYSQHGTRVTLQWGAGYPYNAYLPTVNGARALANCTQIAVAQLATFYGEATISYNGYTFDYPEMRRHLDVTHSYYPAYEGIGRLFVYIGNSQNLAVSYGSSFSSAAHQNVVRTLQNLGFQSGGYWESYNIANLNTTVRLRPVFVVGYAKKKTIQHRFLGIDTWKEIFYEEGNLWTVSQLLTQKRTRSYYVNGTVQEMVVEYRDLYHCNWGYDGSYNGYFAADKFDLYESVTKAQTYYEGRSMYWQFNMQMNANMRRP